MILAGVDVIGVALMIAVADWVGVVIGTLTAILLLGLAFFGPDPID